MKCILAATWNPRGEQARVHHLVDQLAEAYCGIALVLPPDVDLALIEVLDETFRQAGLLAMRLVASQPDWSSGRYLALQKSLELPGDFIQYADFDRLLRWIETRPVEWRQALAAIQDSDCLIFGRDLVAYQTHPQALVQTEALSNRVSSYFLGQDADFSAGSKGFSRQAAEFLVANTRPGRPFGVDAEWPILLRRAGFHVGVIEVSGLDWESADRYQPVAADSKQQRQAAAGYDADPAHWAYRMQIANEIIESAFDAAYRPLRPREAQAFDFDSVFEVDDYMYFYGDMLTAERTEREVDFLIRELELDEKMTILDLACGFGRHANRLAARGYAVTGIDRSPGFLKIAREAALELGVSIAYIHGDMRQLDFQEKFDRVCLMFTAFGYFEDSDNLKVLQNIVHILKPDGQFVLDIRNRDTVLKGLAPYIVTEKDGNLMIDRHTFDTQSGRLHNQRIVIRDGIRRDKPFFVRMYNSSEIQALLTQAGFTTIKLFGDWDSTPISADSRRMIIIAKKS